MSWAKHAIDALQRGETAIVYPRGNSMVGRVRSGAKVTLAPALKESLDVDDVVLCRVKGRDYLHLIKAVNQGRFLIGNNRGGINGWIGAAAIFGKAIKIER